jgi:hypothetical protein
VALPPLVQLELIQIRQLKFAEIVWLDAIFAQQEQHAQFVINKKDTVCKDPHVLIVRLDAKNVELKILLSVRPARIISTFIVINV